MNTLGAPPSKSVCHIGLHAVSKLSYATHAMQWTNGLQRNQKTKICNARTRKMQRMQGELILSLCVLLFFGVFHVCTLQFFAARCYA